MFQKKILILGSEGMLGNALLLYFQKKNYRVFGTSSGKSISKTLLKVEAGVVEKLENIFQENHFDIVINCIAILDNNPQNIEQYEKTVFVNSYFPKVLQKLSFIYNFRLFHISTNGIFSGKNGPYGIHCFPDEYGIYGISKFLGEFEDNQNLTIRTSIIGYDISKNKGLLNWFLSQPEGSEVSGYSNVFWNGMTTLELAKTIESIFLSDKKIIGIQHITGETLSKFYMLEIFARTFHRDIIVKSNDSYFENRTLNPSNISGINYNILPFKEQIQELKSFYNL